MFSSSEQEMTTSNEYYAYFSVSGSFDPSEITTRTGIVPTGCSREGDPIPGTQQMRKCSRWDLHSRLERTDSDLEHHVVDVFNQLDANVVAFKQLGLANYPVDQDLRIGELSATAQDERMTPFSLRLHPRSHIVQIACVPLPKT